MIVIAGNGDNLVPGTYNTISTGIASKLYLELAVNFRTGLISIQAQTIAQGKPAVQQRLAHAHHNGRYLDLDERETRRLIDAQLRAAGWEADTEEIRYSRGGVSLASSIDLTLLLNQLLV